MKCFILVSIFLIGACLAVIIPAREREQLRERAELYMLDTLKAAVSNMRYLGEPLPTNWANLSNTVESAKLFDRARGICEYNHLPPPEEIYTVLARKVANPGWEGGFVFMVRSKPRRWAGLGNGRWALIADPKPGHPTEMRVWLPEDYLPSEIRSQLANKH